MNQDPFRFFRVEAAELSEELSRGVLALETGTPAEVVPRLLRAAHTLKGAARVVKHRALALTLLWIAGCSHVPPRPTVDPIDQVKPHRECHLIQI